MACLSKLWLILERYLVERARTKYLLNRSETMKKNTKDCTLRNTFFISEFGSVMKKL
jgi:hypothetical protein